MVTSIARQGVIIKCNMQSSVMTGNYEFYYGAGLFCKIKGIQVPEDITPNNLLELISPELKKFSGGEKRENYLVKLLQGYHLSEEYDEDMRELLQWGLKEEHMWQVVV
ncbi:MAG: DUF3837 domain-containing protein [Roseburia sp.]|nr:DUF3837 domain-containing protein [Roseburia sp.]